MELIQNPVSEYKEQKSIGFYEGKVPGIEEKMDAHYQTEVLSATHILKKIYQLQIITIILGKTWPTFW